MLETERLTLRKWQASDQPFVASTLGDPDVMAFSDHGPLSSEKQIAWLDRVCAARSDGVLSGPLAIQRTYENDVIGYISLSSNPKRIEPGDAEIGFRLSRRAWGRGYASEAVDAITRAAKETNEIERVVAIVDPHNLRSIRVLQNAGMSNIGEIMLDGYDYPDAFYAINLRS